MTAAVATSIHHRRHHHRRQVPLPPSLPRVDAGEVRGTAPQIRHAREALLLLPLNGEVVERWKAQRAVASVLPATCLYQFTLDFKDVSVFSCICFHNS